MRAVTLLPAILSSLLLFGYAETPHAVQEPWKGVCTPLLLGDPHSVCYDPPPVFHYGWIGER